jgi:hypothetical protein
MKLESLQNHKIVSRKEQNYCSDTTSYCDPYVHKVPTKRGQYTRNSSAGNGKRRSQDVTLMSFALGQPSLLLAIIPDLGHGIP